MNKEIERKYLLSSLPKDLETIETSEIHQIYLATGEEEVRIRKIISNDEHKYTMTYKKGSGLSREEIEFDISKGTYTQLSRKGKPLMKERTKYQLGNHILEVDIYQNFVLKANELIVAEIEFESIEEAGAFVTPTWFKREVTEDKAFKNQSLWKTIQ